VTLVGAISISLLMMLYFPKLHFKWSWLWQWAMNIFTIKNLFCYRRLVSTLFWIYSIAGLPRTRLAFLMPNSWILDFFKSGLVWENALWHVRQPGMLLAFYNGVGGKRRCLALKPGCFEFKLQDFLQPVWYVLKLSGIFSLNGLA